MRDIICDARHFKIAGHYSKIEEYNKLVEEMRELWEVVKPEKVEAEKVIDLEKYVEESADVINTIVHVAIQHGVLGRVMDTVNFKLGRQMSRIDSASLQKVADRIKEAGLEKEVIKMLRGEDVDHE